MKTRDHFPLVWRFYSLFLTKCGKVHCIWTSEINFHNIVYRELNETILMSRAACHVFYFRHKNKTNK